jgi:hypothetical protein
MSGTVLLTADVWEMRFPLVETVLTEQDSVP